MSKKHILFVDDEVNVVEGLRRMLRRYRDEWEMEFVYSGEEALEHLAETPFDVIVSDMQMPRINGAELLEKVLVEYPDVARIVLSGYADEQSTHRALKVAHQFLFKPADAETIHKAVVMACPLEQTMRNERVKAAVARCNTLPSLPTLYMELTRAVESEDVTARQISQIIARDIAMSAKILQLVNSSFFGIGRRVSSIEQTVTLLGLLRIKALVLTEQIFREFSPPQEIRHFCPARLWQHSLLVAEMAREISKNEEQSGDRPDQAFTAGLLHDIGLLIMATQYADEFEQVLDLQYDKEIPLPEAEMQVLNVTHGEVGAYLLGLWGLPARIVEAVALHHNPDRLPYNGICALTTVHVAEALVSEIDGVWNSFFPPFARPQLCASYIKRLGYESKIERWRYLSQSICSRAVECAI